MNVLLKKTMPLPRAELILIQIHKRLKRTKTPKVLNTQRALEYFDIAYPPIYGSRWPSIRLALLSKPKYISVVNNFTDYKGTIQKLELDDDELAARAAKKEMERYPEEYRQRVQAHGSSLDVLDVDFSNRIIKSSLVGAEAGLLMDYVPPTKLKGLENWVEETDVFLNTSQEDSDIGMKKEIQEEPLELPEMLRIYYFLKGDISDFPHPRSDNVMGVLDQYILDGASLLPVLALDIKQDDKVLDLCAAPGGKSLIAMQTWLPKLIVCNDVRLGRLKRLHEVMWQYVPKSLTNIRDRVVVTMENGCEYPEKDAYDKVLVDVPCLTDRHSLEESDNNIFAVARVKDRLKLPEIQGQLLVSALQAVRPGGCVVYSTCTLSPLQNDGAVHLALSKIWQETTIEYSIVDLTYAIQPLKFLYRFGNNLGLRYGQIVLPSLANNFGPMYICKIKRLR
ncbi:5-methylcytosine rRNA methyltransferase NSUN4 isoform X2 [Palaemon carinicauda]|uniref:5-methylcytosine rRNA methyltransferase NSUN4 isoform X2 n=1 Tax=Palaemon carinicauda TaxID=392227 RepID=UPI0035B67027